MFHKIINFLGNEILIDIDKISAIERKGKNTLYLIVSGVPMMITEIEHDEYDKIKDRLVPKIYIDILNKEHQDGIR